MNSYHFSDHSSASGSMDIILEFHSLVAWSFMPKSFSRFVCSMSFSDWLSRGIIFPFSAALSDEVVMVINFDQTHQTQAKSFL